MKTCVNNNFWNLATFAGHSIDVAKVSKISESDRRPSISSLLNDCSTIQATWSLPFQVHVVSSQIKTLTVESH